MRKNYFKLLLNVRPVLLLFLFCCLPLHTFAQIYKHEFGTSAITGYPYTVAPTVLNANLSNSSWQNSVGSWTSNTGASGQAIQLNTPAGASAITLTFNVAAGYVANITSFDFWSRRSNSGPQNWQMTIDGTTVGSGTVTTGGTAIGNTAVSNPVNGLSGTVTVTINVSNAGGGNIRLDDFTLYGTVVSNCNTVSVASFSPASGPADTKVTIDGNGFNNASSVKFNGVTAVYTVVNNTQITATVPAGAGTGNISVSANDGCTAVTTTDFDVLDSQCGTTEIYISEIYDEYAGDPGAIELYNPGNTTITFNGEYVFERYGDYTDTAPTNGYTITLTGSIGPNQTYLLRCGGSNFACSYANGLTFPMNMGGINDNDGFKLRKNGAVIDFVYVPLGNGNSGKGYTMIRKPDATGPSASFIQNDWNIYDNEFCSNLGMHTANPQSAPLPSVTQPVSQAACENGTVSYNAAVTGTGYTYQWKMLDASGNWINVTDGSNYAGATTATLTVNAIPASFNNNQYYCFITSDICQIYTNAVQLTVGGATTAPDVTVTDATCFATGQATVDSPVGTGYTYRLNNGTFQSSPVFANLTAGTYSIVAKDAGGCTSAPYSFTISPSAGAPAVADVTPTQPDCISSTGTLTINSPLGAGLEYSLNGGAYQTGTTFGNLAAGDYTITVKNADGCTSVSNPVTINAAPTAPAVADATPTQPDCTTATGTITINSPIGAGLEYSLNGGAYQTGTTFGNLAAGDYTITVKNTDGCTSVSSPITINTAPTTPDIANVTPTQPDCTTATGTITINSPLGAGLEYSLNGGTYQTATTFSGLTEGSYTITVKNASGCTSVSNPVIINAAPVAPAAPGVTPTQPDCGTPTGTITVTAPLGNDLTYSINGTVYQATPEFSGLSAGTYNVTVKNAEGCISPVTVQVINTIPGSAAPNVSVIQPNCTVTTGTITVNSPTGAGLTYSIDATNYQALPVFSGLAPGTYNVTVMNADGCVSAAAQRIINAVPEAPATPVLSEIQPGCNTPAGSITVVSPTGSGIMYSLNGGAYQTLATFTNLAPGNYSITAKNAAGCISAPATTVLNTPPAAPLAPTVSFTNPDCAITTGTITITAPTGSGLEYSINSTAYQTSSTFTGVASGTYNVTVRNAAGCVSAATSVVISNAPVAPAVPNVKTEQPDCDIASGKITIISPVGAGYTYSIDGTNFQSGIIFSNLAGGTYTVTVKNAAGCTTTSAPVIINNPPAPAPSAGSITGDSSICVDDVLQLTATVTGGVWSVSNDGTATIDNTGLLTPKRPGVIIVYYTVGSQCTSVTSKQITIYALPNPVLRDLYLCEDEDGNILYSKTLSSGLSASEYTFTWTKDGVALPDTSSQISVNETGEYTVTATGIASGCSASDTATVGISSIVSATAVVGQDFSNYQTITINVTGGSGEYEYSLEGGPYQDEPYFRGVNQGEYTVTVRDKNGCGFIEFTVFALNYPRYFSPNGDGHHDYWNISSLANQRDAEVFIYDRYGKLITSVFPSRGRGWDGTLNGYPLPATDYWFTVYYTSSSGTKKEFKAHFSLIR